MKKSFTVILFSLLLFSSCSIGLEKKKEEARKAGYEKGIEQGKSAAKKDFEAKLSSDRQNYENLLSSQKQEFEDKLTADENAYKQKVQETYDNAYKTGAASMQKDLNEVIDMSGKKNRQSSQDKWNGIKTE